LTPELRRNAPEDANRSSRSTADRSGSRIWLYSGDGEDLAIDDASAIPSIGRKQMLWADVDLECADELDELWERLDILDEVAGLGDSRGKPALVQHDHMLHLTVNALDGESLEPIPLHCLVGQNWVVTLHEGELDLVDEFNKPLVGETRLGVLDGPKFLSLVLDWQISGYFKVIEELQEDIDILDEKLLQESPDDDGPLDRLVELRRRVRRLRAMLSPHREVLGFLSHPDSDTVIGSTAAESYQRIGDRIQLALDSVDTAREMIVGSFDIFMTRTAQATNDIMKRLTIVSVLLLPAVVIAGIMGMNFKIGLFDLPWMFWVVVVAMFTLAGVTLVVARRRKWF
jgi:Mg2+ and Co2+ transporter CorA